MVHEVRKGENVTSLIKTYQTTRGTLESLNSSLKLDRLKPGDRVKILSRPGVFQTLQPGLTISDVALAYHTTWNELIKVNGIANPKRIRAGHELFVPDRVPLPQTRRKWMIRQGSARARAASAPRGSFGKPLGVRRRLVVSDSFGYRRNPLTGKRQRHAGADFVAPWGTPVLAARKGVVQFASWKGGYGKLVILKHPKGYQTYYAHVTEILVKEGDEVAEGQVIARVGATGDVTAPHLHFEVRYGGVPKNPLRYLRRFL